MLTTFALHTPTMLSFEAMPHQPAAHFRLYFYAAVLHILSRLEVVASNPDPSRSPDQILFEQFPFLGGYNDELAAYGLTGLTVDEACTHWQSALETWEAAAARPLPIAELRRVTGLAYSELTLLITAGLLEEDTRFGSLFSAMQGLPEQPRPTMALLANWWADAETDPRAALRRLQTLGFLEAVNPAAPRLEWAFQPNPALWEALHGERDLSIAWGRYLTPDKAAPLSALILPEALRHAIERTPHLIASGDINTVVLRGPLHNGRHTTLRAVAHTLGRGILELNGFAPHSEERWRSVGPLATLLDAMPIACFDLAPGETAELPILDGYDGLLGVILTGQGGLTGPRAERALTFTLDIPNPAARRRLWQANLGRDWASPALLDAASANLRLTSGNIQRAAQLGRAYAGLDGRSQVNLDDLQQASRSLNRQALETLAQPITSNDAQPLLLEQLAVNAETQEELLNLHHRIRYRENLAAAVGPALQAQINPGVRALFSGPSGTGKTLAARLLAADLKRDLYRIDLSAVVNKYIGETEKNLNQVFARAEELDVILLLDEGDALLTQRTAVNNSNDRYANLETNYLLQRIESFHGILIVTTNAGDRIDSAFQRRMDVVVNFHMPEAAERWDIWRSHLPGDHAVAEGLLQEIVGRCAISGAQIRNAVLHAALLSLQQAAPMNGEMLLQAVQREYRKLGAICPLAPGPSAPTNARPRPAKKGGSRA
jgi:hypothetical protein